MLEANFSNSSGKNEKILWLFDAKYRIDKPPKDKPNAEDRVPVDAINQMHRYRDALIYSRHTPEPSVFEKSRPVFGAFALYPGFFDQRKDINPYQEAIEEVGIGAFSLLPSRDNSGSIWLEKFLTEHLQQRYPTICSDHHYVEEAPRIAYNGTQVVRFDDLTLIASQLGNNRNPDYIDRFKRGEAKHYHTKGLAFERQNIERHIVQEARYLAVAIDTPAGGREITHIYPIEKAERLKRREITEAQAGTSVIGEPDKPYWLFTLGPSLPLARAIPTPSLEHFQIKISRKNHLQNSQDWNDITEQYQAIPRRRNSANPRIYT